MPWWQEVATKADAHLQVSGKIKFINPDGSPGKQPTGGTTLFGFGEEAVKALLTAQSNGLGLLFKQYHGR